MAKQLSKQDIVTRKVVKPGHVSQSVDAFTGIEAYDITISGSLTVTGSVAINGLTDTAQTELLTINTTTGQLYYTASSAIGGGSISPAGNNFEIQYNNNGNLGATSSFIYNYESQSLENGSTVIASGIYSHAEGQNTQSTGSYSHAEGYSSKAYGDYSHAEGGGDSGPLALGIYSHAEGVDTQALGLGSHAEGQNSRALGTYSHAEGRYTIASGSYQLTCGQYNSHGDSTSLLIVGNGTSNSIRKDAFKIRMSGSIVLPTTQSAAPSWTGTDGEMVFATVTGNHFFYVWMAGAWRSGSLS
jgi:hypothetical protein